MPPKLNGGSPKIAPERLYVRKSTVSNGQCGHPLHSHPNKTLACRQSRPPLRRTWAGTYGLGGRLFLHTSGIARVGSSDLSISWLCFWLVVALSVPGFRYFPLSAYLVSSSIGLSSTRTQAERTIPRPDGHSVHSDSTPRNTSMCQGLGLTLGYVPHFSGEHMVATHKRR